LILLLGLRPSHEVNALALRHLLISTPISERIVSTVSKPSPCAAVRSVPQMRAISGPKSRSGSLRLRDCLPLGRGLELASGSGSVPPFEAVGGGAVGNCFNCSWICTSQ